MSRNGYLDLRCVRNNNIFNYRKFRPGTSFSTQSPRVVENEDPSSKSLGNGSDGWNVLLTTSRHQRSGRNNTTPSQLLSSTLNITQEGCEKLQRVQAQGSGVPGKRKVSHLLLIEPAYYGHFLWSPACLY